MLTILLLEDDETITFALQRFLVQKEAMIICCDTVQKACTALTPAIDIVLLDLNLPDGSGYDFCRTIKNISETPVIFLTVRDDEKDIVHGLDMGADDYIVKPFQLSVLWSRIAAVLRRSKNSDKASRMLYCGQIRADTSANRVWSSEQEIILAAAEYRLLITMMQNKNLTMTRRVLLERIWDIEGDFVEDNTLTVTMKRLRQKLGKSSCIRTLRGIGYRMEDTP